MRCSGRGRAVLRTGSWEMSIARVPHARRDTVPLISKAIESGCAMPAAAILSVPSIHPIPEAATP
jgi:hypothetical protein